MSLYDALAIGVSGLDASSRALSIASSNIANVNTVGYKASQSEFSTMLASVNGGVGSGDSGVMASAQQNIVKQGLAFATTSPTDLAINGNGFFCVGTSADASSQMLYTRAGSFTANSAGDLVNSSGLYLMGWPVGADGTVSSSTLQPVNLSGMAGKGEATTTMSIQANLQASATQVSGYTPGQMTAGTVTPDFQRTIDVYDSQGGAQPIQMSYVKTGANTWAYEAAYTGPEANIDNNGTNPNPIATGTITFNPDGSLANVVATGDTSGNTSGTINLTIPWNTANSGLVPQTISVNMGTPLKTDGTTQFDSASALNNSTVDGAVFGDVIGETVGSDGTVYANYSNGLTQAAFKVPLATFANADGLTSVGGQAYAASMQSGKALINDAGTAGGGTIQADALEGSTVDLATEFTNMITTQQAYSASARVITTASQMLDELMQMQH